MYFPEDLWREIKTYIFVPEYYVGDVIYGIPRKDYAGSQHYNHFISGKGGIVVRKSGRFNKATYYVSVADFRGDYLVLNHNGLKIYKKNMKPLEKLILCNKFGEWWYPMHKLLFQELLIKTIA